MKVLKIVCERCRCVANKIIRARLRDKIIDRIDFMIANLCRIVNHRCKCHAKNSIMRVESLAVFAAISVSNPFTGHLQVAREINLKPE